MSELTIDPKKGLAARTDTQKPSGQFIPLNARARIPENT